MADNLKVAEDPKVIDHLKVVDHLRVFDNPKVAGHSKVIHKADYYCLVFAKTFPLIVLDSSPTIGQAQRLAENFPG